MAGSCATRRAISPRSLGGARDGQSALDALDDLAKHGLTLSARSLATIRGRIEALRQSAETDVLTGDMRLRLSGTLAQAESAVERWPLHTLTFADVADRLVQGFRDTRRALPRSWPETDPEDLHELRKRVVNHRYQMETVAPLWPRFGRMWVGEAQRLRDRLGRHQDLTLLTAPDGAASAAGALALAAGAGDRATHAGSRGGGAPHRLAPVRGEAGRVPAPARRDLGDGGLSGGDRGPGIKKPPAANRGRLSKPIIMKRCLSLAGLAATYSSKS